MGERPRNELWDVLDELFGEARTPQEQTRRGKCVRDLRKAGATPDEVRVTYAYCRRTFTHFTELALLNHLSAAQADSARDTTGFIDAIERMLGDHERDS